MAIHALPLELGIINTQIDIFAAIPNASTRIRVATAGAARAVVQGSMAEH